MGPPSPPLRLLRAYDTPGNRQFQKKIETETGQQNTAQEELVTLEPRSGTRKRTMEYSEDSSIPLHSVDVRIPILTCSYCDRVWRADQPERCVYCAREYGAITQVVDAPRRRALFEAIQAIPQRAALMSGIPLFREQSPLFAAALAEHCPWYDATDPFCVQACWFALSEECPWAHIDPQTQAIWDDFHGPQPIPVEMSQLIFAALFFELDFQDCCDRIIDEDPQEKWAAYLEDQVELHGI